MSATIQRNKPILKSLENTSTQFGFSTHVRLPDANGLENLTLETFFHDVDELVAKRQEWLRFDLNWSIASGGRPGQVDWNPTAVDLFDQAIGYAASKGLKIALVTSLPGFAMQFTLPDYRKTIRTYYEFIVPRYKGKIHSWQVFNEADVHSFRDYSQLQGLSERYLTELSRVMKTAAEVIKHFDPQTPIIANVSRWVGQGPHGKFLKEKTRFFDAIRRSINMIGLDLYPDEDPQEIQRLSQYVAYFYLRYGKDVTVEELGYPSSRVGSTGNGEKSQAKFITQALASLLGGQYLPRRILLYELRDERAAFGSTEGSFGFKRVDNTHKVGYQKVLQIMQPPI